MSDCRKDVKINLLAQEWLEVNRIQWKESTYSKYYYIVHNVIIPMFGGEFISKISTRSVKENFEQMLLEGRSVTTVKCYKTVINCILKYAVDNDYKCSGNINVSLPKKRESEMRVLSNQEQRKLEVELKKSITKENAGILLALYTGIRCGELSALQWGDINLESKCITITKTLQRIQNREDACTTKTKVVIMPPKSIKSYRKIPLPDCLFKMLKQIEVKDKNAYFLTGMRDVFIEPRTLQNIFKNIISVCDLKDINFHALRHTFATRCIELGFDAKTLSEILGHASIKTTLDLYVHSSFDLKINNMKKLNRIAV